MHESLISDKEVSYSGVNESGYIFLQKDKEDLPPLEGELSSLTAEKMSREEMELLVTG
jgi:hypothetical protein